MNEPGLTLRETQVLADLLECQRRLGLPTYEAATGLSTLRSFADQRFDSSVRRLIETALDSLRIRGRVEPPSVENADSSGRRKRLAPYGKEWAALVAVLLNVAADDALLTDRRRKLDLPQGIIDYYNCWTSTSSVLRTDITRDAYAILAKIIVGNHDFKASPRILRAKAAPEHQIRVKIKELVARHGLNHDSWADAISGQYFLTLLARRLEMTMRPDHREMLNRFLASFTYRIDDSLTLNERHILVTPQETALMRECMVEEDSVDTFYSQMTRHRAENVDMDSLHRNYLYGLVLGISSEGGSRVLELVRSLALSHLTRDGAEPGTPLDVDGGWSPYRVPWITARILSSTALLPDGIVSESLQVLFRTAAQSLADRVTESASWRSGVGSWVTTWESTGLCLEALVNHGDPTHSETISAVAESLRDVSDDWRVSPSFAEPQASNETLAAAIISSVLVLASKSGVCEFVLPPSDLLVEQQYMADVLTTAAEAGPTQPRQFCTIPQVMYYASLSVDMER